MRLCVYLSAQHSRSTCNIYMLVQFAHRISFNAATVSAFRRQSTVTPEWTVSMDQMNVDVVSNEFSVKVNYIFFSS